MMKKFSLILVLCLFWSSSSLAFTQETAIDRYLSDRKLDSIEGVWKTHRKNIFAIYKKGKSYEGIVISNEFIKSEKIFVYLQKDSENIFYGEQDMLWGKKGIPSKTVRAKVTYAVKKNKVVVSFVFEEDKGKRTFRRLWPSDINLHNAKFITEK